MTDPRPTRLSEIPAETTTELMLIDIATSLRTIAAALASIDAHGLDVYPPRSHTLTSYQERR